jgi:hypothetical protein
LTGPPAREPITRTWKIALVIALAVLGFSILFAIIKGFPALWAVAGVTFGVLLGGAWFPLRGWKPQPQRTADVAPQPFGALARALLPLVLPLVIILIAGANAFSEPVQIAVGALGGLFAWAAIGRPEAGGLGSTRWLALFVAVGLLAVSLVIVLRVDVTDGPNGTLLNFEDRGGWSSAFLASALIVWAVAAFLRLVSFGTSAVRLVEALLVAWFVWAAIGAAGIVTSSGPSLGVVAIVAGTALGLEAAIGVVALAMNREADAIRLSTSAGGISSDAARCIGGLGAWLAIAAALTMAGGIVIGIDEAGDVGSGELPRGQSLPTADVPRTSPVEELPASPTVFPAELARQYLPVLAFRNDQRWLPTAASNYLVGPGGAKLQRVGRAADPPVWDHTLDGLPTTCPGVQSSPCYRLTIHCPTASSGCAHSMSERSHAFERPIRTGAVYVRVVREDLRGPDAFPDGVGDFYGEAPTILLQYWFFYRYDEWTTPILGGSLVQRHEGDWEAVMVGLSDERPLFVSYSQHCAGATVPWDDVLVWPYAGDNTRPLVAVARGSQANYPNAEQTRSPNWDTCAGLKKGVGDLLSYASDIRDRTAYEMSWEPPAAGLLPASVHHPPMSFPGYWGGPGETLLANQKDQPILHEGEPKTPSMQALWISPLTTVFCTKWTVPARRTDNCPED